MIVGCSSSFGSVCIIGFAIVLRVVIGVAISLAKNTLNCCFKVNTFPWVYRLATTSNAKSPVRVSLSTFVTSTWTFFWSWLIQLGSFYWLPATCVKASWNWTVAPISGQLGIHYISGIDSVTLDGNPESTVSSGILLEPGLSPNWSIAHAFTLTFRLNEALIWV